MSGLGNDVDPGAGNFLSPPLAIGRGDDTILRSPQQQGRPIDAVQPAFQPRVVHIGLPAVKREGLAATHDRRQLGVGQHGIIDLALGRLGPGKPQIFGALDPVHVGDVALVSAT